MRGAWHMAAIRPGGREKVWALPKGLVGDGERAGRHRAPRGDGGDGGPRPPRREARRRPLRLHWEGERVFKVVSFYLVRYSARTARRHPDEFRHEVDETRWLPLEEAPRLLTYKGEREMAAKALQLIDERAV